MRVISGAEIDSVLTWPAMIAALREAFAGAVFAPPRHAHTLARPDGDATLLLMPAWHAPPPHASEPGEGPHSGPPQDAGRSGIAGGGEPNAAARSDGAHAGVKIVSVFPGNAARGRPSVMGTYLLLSGETGAPLAAMDGEALTLWRTGAASALAAEKLARRDARKLVMVGAGALAPRLIAAHASIRPIDHVLIWNRTPARAGALAEKLDGTVMGSLAAPDGGAGAPRRIRVNATADLAAALAEADIVSAATITSDPLIRGAWLKPGAHLDLVGAFRPTMRETDDDAIRRATVYVDTRANALREAGDIVQPLASGVLSEDTIAGDLHDLATGAAQGRRSEKEITLFKSVGSAIEDLAAAALVWRRLGASVKPA